MVLQVALLLCLAASVLAAPLSDTHPLPVDLARAAADVYNQQNTGTQALFKLRQMKNVKKKIFDWGVHFTIGFTIKETHCWKNADYDLQQCKHRDRGQTMDCSLEVTVLDFVQEAPLNSVECHPLGSKKPKQPKKQNTKAPAQQQEVPAADIPVVSSVQYYPSSYATAGLMVPHSEDEAAGTS
ncbi:uncharacterized protein LOC142487938 isoform X2 [Ascaphus truei]|uniref:uncharacterized protein LOC142487938 isoform X2 n=1 Tax=Ascaphus truei TaxID=8439 RepID=UPI003F591560